MIRRPPRSTPSGAGFDAPKQPQQPLTYQPTSYKPAFQARPYHPSMKAPLGDRCVAYLVDSFISQFTCGIYGCFKDGIRDGQSIGKGLMNLRVVDYRTGLPATIGQSFVRNCLCSCLDGCTCYCAMLTSDDGRRLSDQAAGTIVILDR
jgi:hypothetical protein